jgi:TRAP-type C4-dicarboxylate transport system permease small subunit
MKTSLEKVDRALGHISYAGALLGAIAVVLMVVMITINVILRKTSGFAFLFVEEYSGYALVLIVYFGLAYALRIGKHIHMELVVDRLPRRGRAAVELITTVICLGTLVYLLVKSIIFVVFSVKFNLHSDWYSESLLWPFHMLVPIGLTIFMAETVRQLFKKVAMLKKGNEP